MAERARIAHAERVAAAQKANGPPSIGGWVPPSVLSAGKAVSDPDSEGGASDAEQTAALQPASAVSPTEEPAGDDAKAEAAGKDDEDSDGSGSDSGSDSEDDGELRQRPVSFF